MHVPKEVAEFFEEFEPAPYANLTKEDTDKMRKMIAKHQKKEKEQHDKAIAVRSVMKTMCLHQNKEVLKDYRSGDYYNTSSTTYKVVCTDCDDVLFTHVQDGRSYG
jgi:hypothetical protein